MTRHRIEAREPSTTLLRIFAALAVSSTLLVGAFLTTALNPMPPSPNSNVPPAAPIVVVDTPAADGSLPGTGTYMVGTDVQPGDYRSAGAEGGLHGVCYWTRLATIDPRAEAAIQSGAGRTPQTVTVQATDAALKTAGCQRWEQTR